MQIQTNKEQKELKSHGDYRYPVCISYERIKAYESGQFHWHWHPEIELTLILSGHMLYQINQDTFLVSAGDALFGNCNTLHSGRMISAAETDDCEYLSITFHPRILYGTDTSLLKSRYVDCICEGNRLPSLHIDGSEDWHIQAAACLQEIHRAVKEQLPALELRTQIALSQFWLLLYTWFQECNTSLQPYSLKNQERLQNILFYIQNHYAEKITLEDIAASVNICRSECCRFFKNQLGETLFQYLMRYRIQQSLPLLSDFAHSITEISEQCGFSSPAYYSKIFTRFMEMSPAAYRKNSRLQNNDKCKTRSLRGSEHL